MTMMRESVDIMTFLIPLLYLVAVGGITYAFITALKTGVDNYANVYTQTTAQGFADIFFFIPRRRILEMAWAAAVLSFVVFFLVCGGFSSMSGMIRGLVVGMLVAGLCLAAPKLILRYLKQKRILRFNEQLVDALMTMSNALKAGSSIMQAFEHIVKERQNPISQEFGMFLQQTRVGVKFEEALDNLEKRVNSEDLTLVISSIETARQTGGNLTEVFEQITGTIRERMRIQEKVRTLTSQGRLQGIVVGSMPILLAFVMFALDPRMMMTFFHSTVGIGVMIAAVLLEVSGALLIRKIIDIDI